jgi:hypothetical protein
VTVTRSRSVTVPWARFVPSKDCACTLDAPCLLHYDTLDWKGQAAGLARVGVQTAPGR